MSTAQPRYCAACGGEIKPEDDSVIIAGKWYHWTCFQKLYSGNPIYSYTIPHFDHT